MESADALMITIKEKKIRGLSGRRKVIIYNYGGPPEAPRGELRGGEGAAAPGGRESSVATP